MAVITIPGVLRESLGEEGAEAFANVLKEFETDSHKSLASKEDIFMLKADIARLEGEIKTIKWMLGIAVAGVASLIIKSFFM